MRSSGSRYQTIRSIAPSRNLGFSACERPAQGLQAEMPRPWTRSKKTSPSVWAQIRAKLAPDTPVEVWFQDEMRVGQKNKLTYRWARKGSRPRAAPRSKDPIDLSVRCSLPRTREPAPPSCCQPAIPKLCSFNLNEDRNQKSLPALTLSCSSIKPAGMAPRPSRFQATSRSCSCRHARPNSTAKKISGNLCGQKTGCRTRIFKSFDDIVDHCCYAWNTLIDQPWKIMSIARRDWVAAGSLQSEDWY